MTEVLTLKDIPEDARPRERLLRCGGKALSDAELVAILLRSGRPGLTVVRMASEVLEECGGLLGLLDAEYGVLVRNGLGRAKAAALLAAVELGRRLARARIPERQLLNRPDVMADYLALRYARQDQEVMGAVFLDVRNRLLADVEIYRGTLSRASVEPRLILKEALQRNASAFVVFHTHPSGDPAPSSDDLAFTRQLSDASEIVGVTMHDHLIVGTAGRFVSLRRRGSW
ncbi:MAG TPA: DNA repair protein RadC [Thermoanaerobaculia bacterium]